MRRHRAWLCLVIFLAAGACGGGDSGESNAADTGAGTTQDGLEELSTPDAVDIGPEDIVVPPDQETPEDNVIEPEDVEPCDPDCDGKQCGDDNGCGKPCVVDKGCEGNPPCSIGVCDQTGVCGILNTDAECDDGNLCTAGDVCNKGKCKGGQEPPDCDDGNACTNDACDPAEGCYSLPNALPCEDGDPCTKGDQCSDGDCIPGGPDSCDDNNACTEDWCDAVEGCKHQSMPDVTSCSDNNECTTGDHCSQGACLAGQATNCNDMNPCTTDTCAPLTGCAHSSAPANTPCNDYDICTEDDYCSQGACIPGAAKNCDDFNGCTTDSCSNGQCIHTPLSGDYFCTDEDPCTEPDWCDNGVCQPGPILPGCN